MHRAVAEQLAKSEQSGADDRHTLSKSRGLDSITTNYEHALNWVGVGASRRADQSTTRMVNNTCIKTWDAKS